MCGRVMAAFRKKHDKKQFEWNATAYQVVQSGDKADWKKNNHFDKRGFVVKPASNACDNELHSISPKHLCEPHDLSILFKPII